MLNNESSDRDNNNLFRELIIWICWHSWQLTVSNQNLMHCNDLIYSFKQTFLSKTKCDVFDEHVAFLCSRLPRYCGNLDWNIDFDKKVYFWFGIQGQTQSVKHIEVLWS